ncbi:uncharacterized protein LOC106171228, partial [Lingula anatina]|uniref:Uncharacterized protein LOC106171228 n=1 Tax=Lingula anatina TaxID=7574 RepID=A0A1S3J9C9_LINAN
MSERQTTDAFPGVQETEPKPEIFTVPPPQPKKKKPGQLTAQQVKQFFEEGYVVVEDFFTHEELDACRDAVAGLVDDLAKKLYDGGKIKKLHRDQGLFTRLTAIEKEFPGANIILHKSQNMPK